MEYIVPRARTIVSRRQRAAKARSDTIDVSREHFVRGAMTLM